MNDKIKKAFDSYYLDYFELIKNKEVLSYYSYSNNESTYHIKLLKGHGIFKTVVYMVQVLKEKDAGYSKQDKLNKQFHIESLAIDYISKLVTGSIDHA